MLYFVLLVTDNENIAAVVPPALLHRIRDGCISMFQLISIRCTFPLVRN